MLSSCLGHALLALCGSAAHNGRDLLTSALQMLSRTQLALAVLGLLLLCTAGATSARAIRGRIPHETWRAVHLLTCLGAALGIAHQMAGPDLAENSCALGRGHCCTPRSSCCWFGTGSSSPYARH
ncbi:ferric reductase-like transmembrane domain-containing protein [Streptomyces sp. NPDC059832]|uniref:ferric reductase-like transmembrane domain-containing protein n=1 Tax=Streptomyces sp. NPDC059832 TaxID=3346966 RepID=UPI003669FCFB